MKLIGRRRELAALTCFLDRSGGWLLVSGPPGAGKTALLEAAVELAGERGLPVTRLQTVTGPPSTVESGRRLVLVDDLDRDGRPPAVALAHLAAWLDSGATAIVAAREPFDPPDTMAPPLGVLRLRALTETELADLLPDSSADAVHAVWLLSAGLPGPALAAALELADVDGEPLTHLALATPSRAEFLDLDTGLLRLLEAAAAAPAPPPVRARILARLARELLSDPTAADRRRALVDEAVALARQTDDAGTIAEVHDCGLHALWDPVAARERLAVATDIITYARRAGDVALELRGLMWAFTAHAERADLTAAETALATYARIGAAAGHAETAVVVTARQAMLATVRGRFDTALALAAEVAEGGQRAGVSDTDRLVASLRGRIAMMRGEAAAEAPKLQALARRLPGHHFEATAARALIESGHEAEAALELERALPAVLAGAGPRWVGVLADLAAVAARTGPSASARALYHALLPFAGRLVVWAGAATITGPVDDYLARLAARLGMTDEAMSHWDSATKIEERLGALPWLAETLALRAAAFPTHENADDDVQRARTIAQRLRLDGVLGALDAATRPVSAPEPSGADRGTAEWRLTREGDTWLLDTGTETARLRDTTGLRYLRTLLTAPNQEIPALDLVAGGTGIRVSGGDPLLDQTARVRYRHRLAELEAELDAADRAGDVDRAAVAERERHALLAELRRATGLGGRARTHTSEAERARVNATRALRTTIQRMEAAAPLAGLHLRRSLRTGQIFRYQPTPDGPVRWRL